MCRAGAYMHTCAHTQTHTHACPPLSQRGAWDVQTAGGRGSRQTRLRRRGLRSIACKYYMQGFLEAADALPLFTARVSMCPGGGGPDGVGRHHTRGAGGRKEYAMLCARTGHQPPPRPDNSPYTYMTPPRSPKYGCVASGAAAGNGRSRTRRPSVRG